MPLEVKLTIGRIFRLLSRPAQPGDMVQYERCRAIIMEHANNVQPGYQPCYARDRLRGAQGDY